MAEDFDILKQDDKFRYQLLGRLRQDCDYYLGYGNRCAKHLWSGDEKEIIITMKLLWNSFLSENKPEWLTWDEILEYEKAMLQ